MNKRKLRKGGLEKCTICNKSDFYKTKFEIVGMNILVTWKCKICNSKWVEYFQGLEHLLTFNGRTNK